MNVILTHLPPKPESRFNLYAGRPVACAALLEAIVKFSPDHRIIVYTPASLRNDYQRLREGYSNPSRLELMDAKAIKQSIGKGEQSVIQTFNTSLRYGLHLRWLCGCRPWPVVGLTHDLSSREVYEELLLAHITPPAPYDAIVTTSRCAHAVISNLIAKVSSVFERESPLRLKTIPLGIDVESFETSERDSARQRLKLFEDRPILLYLGRISHAMKADIIPLITAFSQLKCDQKPALVIAGGVLGELEQGSVARIKDYISEMELNRDVCVLTNVTAEQRIDLLSATDVLVSPADSLQESFGLVLLEAMAAGLPVIASDWNGYRELVDDSKTGLLIETLVPNEGLEGISHGLLFEERFWWYGEFSQSVVINIKQLIQAMTRLVENTDLAQRMGQAGRERVLKHYDWQHIIAAYQAHWRCLAVLAMESDYSIGVSPFTYSHSNVFHKHPSKTFDENVTVQRTREAAQESYALANPPAFLSAEKLYGILNMLVEPTRIVDLASPVPDLNRHIAYLLKHGLAEIIDD